MSRVAPEARVVQRGGVLPRVLALVEVAERTEVDPRPAKALRLPDLVQIEEQRLRRRSAVTPSRAWINRPGPIERLLRTAGLGDGVGEADEVGLCAAPLAEPEGGKLGKAVLVARIGNAPARLVRQGQRGLCAGAPQNGVGHTRLALEANGRRMVLDTMAGLLAAQCFLVHRSYPQEIRSFYPQRFPLTR